MPLHLLVPLVVGGIFAIMIATVVMGLNKPRRFETEAEALYAWQREFPRSPATSATLCGNRSAALVETARGPGLVWAMGADSTARLLTGARVETHCGGLVIHLPDFAAPVARLALAPDEAKLWADRIGAPS